ncbi:hypothetical protein V5799_010511 [Amblyomma americanum]|uniref:Uncharacterized protein n=1 Tax=Amblyomma americanum TaxID=6943 RepID=A0AAQ4EJJ3_AMBAM
MKAWTRRPTIEHSSCATALHLDEFVNDSLEGIRLPLEGPTEKITAHNTTNTDLQNYGASENAAYSADARTEPKHMMSAHYLGRTIEQTTGTEKSKVHTVMAEESKPVARQEKRAEPMANSKTASPGEQHNEPGRLQQAVNDSVEEAGSRHGNENYMAAEDSDAQASAKRWPIRESGANQKSGVHLPGDSVSMAKVLLMGEQASNSSVLGESKIDAPSDVRKPPGAGSDDAERHTTEGNAPDGRGHERRPPAKAVKIAHRTSLIENEEILEATQLLKRREVNAWLENCRLACENLSSMVALVLVVLIIFHVARPMYVGDSVPEVVALRTCYDQWCDRLGLRVLPNKSNQGRDPCGNFYLRVCYEWNVGHENTGFVGGVIDSAYGYTRDRIYRSQMPAVVRNDLDHFVIFLRVCLEDAHFQAPLSEWMALIRYELRHDFLVKPHWNWSRMVRSVIKKSLVDGLQTIVGVRVGRQERSQKADLFLFVDGCLLSLLSVKTNQTRVVASLLAEIIDELPEFRDRMDVVAAVIRMSLAISRERKYVVKRQAYCSELASFTTGVGAATWVNEINRHVPADMRLADECMMMVYERISRSRLFNLLEEQSTEARALYINLLMVGQVLRFRYGLVASAQPKLRVCMQASRGAFRHLWVRLMMDVVHLHVQVRYLEELFENIKQGIVADLERRGGSNVTKLAVVALVNKTQLRNMSRASVADEAVYRGPHLAVGYRLPQYFLQTLAFQTKRSVNFLVDDESLADDEEMTSLRPVYIQRDLTISVPFFFLFRPLFFVFDEEQYHNFATVGVLMAVQLIEEANRRSLLDKNAANKSATCRVERYLKTVGTGGDQPASPRPPSVLFAWEVAVNVALRSMEKYVQRNMSPMEKLKYMAQLRRIFFERFCMLSCALPPVPNISNMQRCLLPLMNMPEFADAYSCSSGSNMFPSERCGEM